MTHRNRIPIPTTILPEGTRALLTEGEVADLLAVCPRTLRRWRGQGRLRAMKLGGAAGSNSATRYARTEIERFLATAVRS